MIDGVREPLALPVPVGVALPEDVWVRERVPVSVGEPELDRVPVALAVADPDSVPEGDWEGVRLPVSDCEGV